VSLHSNITGREAIFSSALELLEVQEIGQLNDEKNSTKKKERTSKRFSSLSYF